MFDIDINFLIMTNLSFFIVSLVVYYAVLFNISKDPIFFVRKRVFYEQIKEVGDSLLFDYFLLTLDTKVTDWKYDYNEKEFSYVLENEDGKSIIFKNSPSPTLTLYLANGVFEVFSISVDEDFKELSFTSKKLKNLKPTTEQEINLFRLLKKLNDFYSVYHTQEVKPAQKGYSNDTQGPKTLYIEKPKVVYSNPLLNEIVSLKEELKELENEKKWLSVESMHKISHTLPNDLDRMLEVYESLRNQDEMEEHIKQTLLLVKEKKTAFVFEIEEKKKNELKKLQETVRVR